MPRYLVERTFPSGLHIPVGAGGRELRLAVVEKNASEGVYVAQLLRERRQGQDVLRVRRTNSGGDQEGRLP
jgi:hypothetical protein